MNMESATNYRRPGFIHRPWIHGKLYDQYANANILHCDAHVLMANEREYLIIDCHTGGRKQAVIDAWLVEPDGLTEVNYSVAMWARGIGTPVYWGRENHAVMRRVHKHVLAHIQKIMAIGNGRWAREVVQTHYVYVTEKDGELGALNKYVAHAKAEPSVPKADDLLFNPKAIGKRRGRPRKEDTMDKPRAVADLLADKSVGTIPDILNEPELDPGDLRYVSQKVAKPKRKPGRPRKRLPDWL